jgi:hypothetical protein
MEAKAEIGIHNPSLDRLPVMRPPADDRVMSETILGVVRSSPGNRLFDVQGRRGTRQRVR